jgi:DNA-binding SARP family transcriptional activator
MRKVAMGNNPIEIQTFGEFRLIGADGKISTEEDIRSGVMTRFLVYMLINRDHINTKEELIENLWFEGEIDNPSGTLKNLTYRVRNFLKKNYNDDSMIQSFSRGGYMWNPNVPVHLDIDEFDKCYDIALDQTIFPDDRISWCEKIIDIYKGAFVPKIADMLWATNISMYYKNRYLKVVDELVRLYQNQEDYDKIINLVNKAIVFDSLNEGLYCKLIEAFIATGNRSMAEETYDHASTILYDELGIRNPKDLSAVREKILKMTNGSKTDTIVDVCGDIEEENVDGVFFCGYPVFREVYRLEARKISRLGEAEYVALFTLNNGGSTEAASDLEKFRMDKGMKILENVLNVSLRVGDVVSRYSDYQYIILLSACSYESTKMIVNRITDRFNSKNSNPNLSIKSSIEEVSNEDHEKHILA